MPPTRQPKAVEFQGAQDIHESLLERDINFMYSGSMYSGFSKLHYSRNTMTF